MTNSSLLLSLICDSPAHKGGDHKRLDLHASQTMPSADRITASQPVSPQGNGPAGSAIRPIAAQIASQIMPMRLRTIQARPMDEAMSMPAKLVPLPSEKGSAPVFMPKKPVTSVGGSRKAVISERI